MLSRLFLGISLVGAEWVLYLLVLISVISVAVMVERALYYQQASRELAKFRGAVRAAMSAGRVEEAGALARERARSQGSGATDLETEMAAALLAAGRGPADVLDEVARDSLVRARIRWDRNLAVLATIGNNAPFVGLFGTVLGIIKAFHDLSQNATNGAGVGATGVTAGISEALVATAFGLLVAIPAVVAYNFYQRRVKAAVGEAEALKSFLISRLAR